MQTVKKLTWSLWEVGEEQRAPWPLLNQKFPCACASIIEIFFLSVQSSYPYKICRAILHNSTPWSFQQAYTCAASKMLMPPVYCFSTPYLSSSSALQGQWVFISPGFARPKCFRLKHKRRPRKTRQSGTGDPGEMYYIPSCLPVKPRVQCG